MKIIQLDSNLANMIAAGEVVEKPSSVVKELVENSIDAHATIITIELKNSGIDEIKVTDNGVGMDKVDANMALRRHATSKIKNEPDLFRISTLGFRGEAIPSIASVSKMTIETSEDGVNGYKVYFEGGNKIKEENIPFNKGTRITVSNLFYNTPARLKFLSSANSELGSITFIVDKLALANPNIRFKLYHNGVLLQETIGDNKINTLFGYIYGLNVAKNMVEKHVRTKDFDLHLSLVKPTITKARKLDITLLVNNRYVRNQEVTNAVVEAYKGRIPVGRYPIVLINLIIDPYLIDVNVHPAKTEIKISILNDVLNVLELSIKEELKKMDLIYDSSIEIKENKTYLNPGDVLNLLNNNEKQTFNSEETPKNEVIKEEINLFSDVDTVPSSKKIPSLPYMEYIGILHGTYLLFQNEFGLYLVDQHAANERINYELNLKKLNEKEVSKVNLLTPIVLDLTKDEVLFLEDNIDKMNSLGFEINILSLVNVTVSVVPNWIDINDPALDVYNVFKLLIDRKSCDLASIRDTVAKMVSCKASIKANQYISKVEVDTLMERLASCENPYNCPHGRPTIVKLTTYEIEKMFKRVM